MNNTNEREISIEDKKAFTKELNELCDKHGINIDFGFTGDIDIMWNHINDFTGYEIITFEDGGSCFAQKE